MIRRVGAGQRIDFAHLTSKKDLDAQRSARGFPSSAKSLRAISPDSYGPWRTRHHFVATGLRRITGLGCTRTPTLAKSRPGWFSGSAVGADCRGGAPGPKTSLSGVL